MPVALVVDDAPDIRMLVREILERSGFDVVEAAGGTDALDSIDGSVVPDVVVLDVQMPIMDGWEVLSALRRRRETADVRVVLCTVKAGPADTLRAWDLGCDGYLTKPFDIGVLADEVVSVATRTPSQRQQVRDERRAAALAGVEKR
jgi:CheY-like chemotaxis protein